MKAPPCTTGKKRHASKRAAGYAAKQTGGSRGNAHPYRCSICGGWHVGHHPALRANDWRRRKAWN